MQMLRMITISESAISNNLMGNFFVGSELSEEPKPEPQLVTAPAPRQNEAAPASKTLQFIPILYINFIYIL
jgi:hypothetical protein